MTPCASPPFRREKKDLPPDTGRKVTAYRYGLPYPCVIVTYSDKICNKKNTLKRVLTDNQDVVMINT